ncbi:MAG: hypothetical protein KGL95_15910, partial [Patescibacteria group bacterium]|nr:hypothetical protein [Patescibacteria group bacterium]
TSLSGAGLIDCSKATDKVQWNALTKTFGCGTSISTVKSYTSLATFNVTYPGVDTKDYWDNSQSSPKITMSDANDEILVQVHIEFQDSGPANSDEIGARIVRSTRSVTPASNQMCQWSADKIQIANANTVSGGKGTPGTPELSFTYVDATASANGTNPLYYSVCSSALSAGAGTSSVQRIDIVLSEVGTASDIAELYPTLSTTLQNGDIVTADANLINGVKLENTANDSQVLGVVSTKPSQIVGGATPNNNGVPVALNGRVPVKVTTLNGDIASGSAITTSNLPGFGQIQTQPGTIVGQALEGTSNWNTNSCTVLTDWSQANNFWPYDDGTNLNHPCFAIPTNTVPNVPATYTDPYVYVGKIMMKVENSYNKPEVFTSNPNSNTKIQLGSQIGATQSANSYFLTDNLNNILTNDESFS